MTIDFTKTPALRYLLFFCLGLILNSFLKLSLALIVIFLICNILLIIVFNKRAWVTCLFILCIVLSAMLHLSLADAHYNRKTEISFKNQKWLFTVLSQKTNPFYIKSYVIAIDKGNQKIKGSLYARSTMPILVPGKVYSVSSLDCSAITPKVNPYVFDYRQYAKSKGISHSFKMNKNSKIEDLGVKNKLRYTAFMVRSDISTRYLSVLGIEKGSLVNGLLLGLKSEIPTNLADLFKKMGVSHLLAVSGLHVGLIIMILYQLIQILGIPRVPRTLIIVVFLLFYCILTGGSASVVRSSLMSVMLLFAPILKRKYHAMNAVAATALILLLMNPFALNDVGFQFSFAAVFGILIAYPKFRALITIPSSSKLLKYVWDMLAVSLSAALFTAPVAMFYFNSLQVGSMALNCLVIPLTFVVMICAIICLPCLYFPSFISDIFIHALDLSLHVFRAVLRLASRSGIWTLHISSYWKALYLGAFVIILALIIFEKNKTRIVVMCVCFISFLFMFYVQTRPEFIVLALDKGKCMIYRKGQKALLINTGAMKFGSNDYDRNIKPSLEHFGIKNVEMIITENTKQKTGNISGVKRDYSHCSLYLADPLYEQEGRVKKVLKDTTIIFAGDSIHLDYGDANLELSFKFAGEKLYLQNKVIDAFPTLYIDQLRTSSLHYRAFRKICQELH